MELETTTLLSFIRHGEKDTDGQLTAKGFQQARARGLKTPSLGGKIILFHSGVGRVRDTVRTAAAHLHLDETSQESLEAGEHIVDYVTPNLHFLLTPTAKGEYHKHWQDVNSSPAAVNARMREFLRENSTSPEPNIWLSPRQMAQNIALMIGVQVRFANMITPDTCVTFVNGTHEPVLMSFLHYALNNYKPGNNDTTAMVGGSVQYAEGFEIYVSGKDQRHPQVSLRFRDIAKQLDLDTLRAFAYGTL